MQNSGRVPGCKIPGAYQDARVAEALVAVRACDASDIAPGQYILTSFLQVALRAHQGLADVALKGAG
eukprot:9339582-Pyramimonas_sp.AAC.1